MTATPAPPTAHDPVSVGIVIPTLNAAHCLAPTLAALNGKRAQADALAAGLMIADLLVCDGGSGDETPDIARRGGARLISAPAGRGTQLAAGAAAARGDWLFFIHADTIPPANWPGLLAAFARRPQAREQAACFHFALSCESRAARCLERLVAWRCRFLGLAYGDQGLFIHRAFYRRLGGYPPLPLMEDVALVQRIGRRRMVWLAGAVMTDPVRYRRDGYIRRSLRNALCLGLFFLGVKPALLRRLYG